MIAKVLAIPDLHLPYHHAASYSALMAHIEKEKPTHVVQLGDLLDFYVFSTFPRNLRITPAQDVEIAIVQATEMWEQIRALVPGVKCFQLLGNHDMRLAKRIHEKIPELADIFSHRNLYKFDGVAVLDSDRDFLLLDEVVYVHGWFSKSIQHAIYFGKPVVHGHLHKPSLFFDTPRLWAMDCGYLADEMSLPLRYTNSTLTKWTRAFGVVEDQKPRLVIL